MICPLLFDKLFIPDYSLFHEKARQDVRLGGPSFSPQDLIMFSLIQRSKDLPYSRHCETHNQHFEGRPDKAAKLG
jgi:hypothetical protein